MTDKHPLVIGLKYCGGCRAGYDRVALVEQIKRQLDGQVRFVRHDDPGARIILAVHGCLTACADLTTAGDRVVRPVTSAREADAVILFLKEMALQKMA